MFLLSFAVKNKWCNDVMIIIPVRISLKIHVSAFKSTSTEPSCKKRLPSQAGLRFLSRNLPTSIKNTQSLCILKKYLKTTLLHRIFKAKTSFWDTGGGTHICRLTITKNRRGTKPRWMKRSDWVNAIHLVLFNCAIQFVRIVKMQ